MTDSDLLARALDAKAGAEADRTIVGWREWANLPALGIERIEAKIDTGAKTSAIDAIDIEECVVDGAPHVAFSLPSRAAARNAKKSYVLAIADKRRVRSSNGKEAERFVVETELRLGAHAWPIELTLADRDTMEFRLLIGREALRGLFVVDPGAVHLLGR